MLQNTEYITTDGQFSKRLFSYTIVYKFQKDNRPIKMQNHIKSHTSYWVNLSKTCVI